MKCKLFKQEIIFLLIVALFNLNGCGKTVGENSGGYDVTDVQGTVVHMPAKPERIVTLSMSTDEIVLGLVKPEKMAAVNAMLDDKTSSNVYELGKMVEAKVRNPSVEEIMALKPDLVIVPDWGNLEKVESMRSLGLKVVVVQGAKSQQEIRDSIQIIADAIGEPVKGKKLLGKMDEKLAEIKAKTAKIPTDQQKEVVLISLMTNYGGKDCTFNEACELANVRNGMAEAGMDRNSTLSKEMLLKINPDIIFLPTYNDHGNFDIAGFRSKYLDDPSLQTMKAIRNKALLEPREAYIYNGSQDFVFAVQEIAYVVYGDDFQQSDHEHLSVAEDE